jgi:hypothetical protein
VCSQFFGQPILLFKLLQVKATDFPDIEWRMVRRISNSSWAAPGKGHRDIDPV